MQGSKLARVDVVYTPWANLRKTANMAVGQARDWRATDARSAAALPLKTGSTRTWLALRGSRLILRVPALSCPEAAQ